MNDTSEESVDVLVSYDDFNYTYSYQDSLDWLPLNELVPCVTFYVIIGLLGITGNSLVIIVILALPRTRNITNLFLLSLASADLLLVLVCVPIKCATFFSYTWRMGAFLCIFTHFTQTVSMVCSVMTLTVMSIERFVAIVYPLRARSVCTVRHARVVIGVIWTLSCVLSAPVLYIQDLKEVGRQIKAYWCIKTTQSPVHSLLFEVYMFVILFIVPITIMVISYSRISHEIWNVSSRRASLSARRPEEVRIRSKRYSKENGASQELITKKRINDAQIISNDAKTRKQVILMLIVIVLFFFLCWGPILLNNLLVALNVLDKLNIGFLKPMRMAFHLLSYSNSCVNPIVYGIMSHNFRDRLRRTLSRRATRNRSLTATSTFQSRSSTMRRRQNSNYSKTRL
uniref:G-protein coupled receptors family 1 profile domain-containing protein n=2 Tax=Magallana gigas TaxID=29159 RepID=A0A8W8KN60_MAGGI|nr:gastrin/cholecystokinin type B receptor isoform X1 [Crassostrea gigas]